MAYRHSGYPGGLSATPIGELLEKDARQGDREGRLGHAPEEQARSADAEEAPKVYSGPTHPHTAQQAVPFEITQISQ